MVEEYKNEIKQEAAEGTVTTESAKRLFEKLQALFTDDTVTEIIAVSQDKDLEKGLRPLKVYFEREGRLSESADAAFGSAADLETVIGLILESAGKHSDIDSLHGCVMLPGGSVRAEYSIPPVSLGGPTLMLKKFRNDMNRVEDLVDTHVLTPAMAAFLRSAVASRCPIVISGGGCSGKTTLLNVLAEVISPDERISIIEEIPELQIHKPHIKRWMLSEENNAGFENKTLSGLIRQAFHHRPDRIILGECRGVEAYEMLLAMKTGLVGAMTTVHAYNSDNALSRLSAMVVIANGEMSPDEVKRFVCESLAGGLIVQIEYMLGGKRLITGITEVGVMTQVSKESPITKIFEWKTSGQETEETNETEAIGCCNPCGVEPQLAKARILAAGEDYNPEWFAAASELMQGK